MARTFLVDYYTARPPRALGGCQLFWTYSYAQLHALLARRALGLHFRDSSCRLTGLGLSLPQVVVTSLPTFTFVPAPHPAQL